MCSDISWTVIEWVDFSLLTVTRTFLVVCRNTIQRTLSVWSPCFATMLLNIHNSSSSHEKGPRFEKICLRHFSLDVTDCRAKLLSLKRGFQRGWLIGSKFVRREKNGPQSAIKFLCVQVGDNLLSCRACSGSYVRRCFTRRKNDSGQIPQIFFSG